MLAYFPKFRIGALCAGALALGSLAACDADERDAAQPFDAATVPAFIDDPNEDGRTVVTGLELDFVEALETHAAGLAFDLTDAEEVYIERPDGTTDHMVAIEGDGLLPYDTYRELLDDPLAARQYRSYNLVSQNRTIDVVGYTGGYGFGLTSTQQTALQWAINNYNRLDIGLTFNLRFGARTDGDIVVHRQPYESGAGGKAGFPSGGRPFKWVELYTGMDTYNTDVNEHVITHEIGHAVGLRHTDWFSRESCGQSGESRNPDGAELIPGTPSGYDANSVMLACFASDEDGEFGYYDRVALEYLY